jgi:hypothetical protein
MDHSLTEFVPESCFLAENLSDIYRGFNDAGFLCALHFFLESVEGVERGVWGGMMRLVVMKLVGR